MPLLQGSSAAAAMSQLHTGRQQLGGSASKKKNRDGCLPFLNVPGTLPAVGVGDIVALQAISNKGALPCIVLVAVAHLISWCLALEEVCVIPATLTHIIFPSR